MTPRKPRARKPKPGKALVPASVWVPGEQADWLITSAHAAYVPPRFDLDTTRSDDRKYLAGIDVVNAALGIELDEQADRASRGEGWGMALALAGRSGAVAADGPECLLPPAPVPFGELEPADEERMAAIEAAWEGENDTWTIPGDPA